MGCCSSSREKDPLLKKTPEEPDGDAKLTTGVPLMFRLKGTVIIHTWWQILLVVLYTSALVGVHFYVDEYSLDFPQALIDILGIVTGLLLAFRTQTAYER
jgi:predicted membrane chloride channel (bestrophin family)